MGTHGSDSKGQRAGSSPARGSKGDFRLGRVLPVNCTTYEGRSQGDKLCDNNGGRNQTMTKNIVIALLTLGIIALSWINLSDTPEEQGPESAIQHRIEILKDRIDKAYNVAKHKSVLNDSHTYVKDEKIREDKEPESKDSIVARENYVDGEIEEKIRGQDKGEGLEQSRGDTQSATDILRDIGQDRKQEEGPLTKKELKSILAILKSAQNLLKKTSFDFQDSKKKNLPTEEPNPQTSIIKKKLSSGPDESG